MSTQFDGTEYLHTAIRSNNKHNQALIAVLDQLITTKSATQQAAPAIQHTVPAIANKTYEKQYGTAYDFAAMTVPKRGERAPPLTMQSAPIQQQRSQLSSQPSTMVPSVTTSTSKGKQARSMAVLQTSDPKRHSKSAHIPTFELTSHSTLGVPNMTLFPVSINSLEMRGRSRQGHPHMTDRNNAEG